jgi:ketosteroid isomerase-like protein
MLKLTLGLVLLGANVTPARSQTPSDSAAAVHAIRTALAGWVKAANREDWKAAANVWAPDLVGWYPGQPDDTYAREMDRLAHPRLSRGRTRYEVDVVEVIVSGPLAVVRDVWRFTSNPGSSDSSIATVRSYEVWKRQPDHHWKIARWISAPEPAPPK